MRQWIRSHLTFANVVSLAALFVALGGTATAVTYVVSSNSQVGPATISGHKPPTGKHANIIGGSVNGKDVADNSLTGADVLESSLKGLRNNCPSGMTLVGKAHDLCVDATNRATGKNWADSAAVCENAGLRLPSISEALEGHAVLDAGAGPYWTDDAFKDGSADVAYGYSGVMHNIFEDQRSDNTFTVRCVATPSDA